MEVIARMGLIRQSVCVTCFILLLSCFAFGQKSATSNDVLLTVGGKVEHAMSLTRSDFDKFNRQVVSAKTRDGKETKYAGVATADILQKAGVQFGEAIHQEAAATYLLSEAVDGYRVIFALPEFDSAPTDRIILIAD